MEFYKIIEAVGMIFCSRYTEGVKQKKGEVNYPLPLP